jgi:hypothetical protein
MTDAWLMEADCVHGMPWYDCEQCIRVQQVADDQATDEDWADD